MKKPKITSATFEIVELTKRTKKMKSVEIIITYDNTNPYENNTFKRVVENIDKYQFNYRIPFTTEILSFSNFSKVSFDKQYEALTDSCNRLVGKEVKVGNIGDRYIDLEVEEVIKRNNQIGSNMFIVPSYCYFGGDYIEMYNDENELSVLGQKIKQCFSSK